jgi:tetratricopeptide (TPR) repeat protein
MQRAEFSEIRHYPMGPKTRSFLAISDQDYRGSDQPLDSAEHRERFSEHLLHALAQRPVISDDELTDLIDELVAMDLPGLVLAVVGERPQLRTFRDFRCQLSLGVAAMLTGDQDLAEDALRSAQEILPAEPAPYINIVQILLSQSRIDEALVWCESGLEQEPNNHALWELMAHLRQVTDGEAFPDMIMRLANQYNSWAGLSLAASLSSSGDRYLKVNLLDKLYAQGERDPQFLIEYTAALGVAGDMEKIPQVIWLAETSGGSQPLNWQLYLHAAQACLAMDRFQECLSWLGKAEKSKFLPDEARAAMSELKTEAEAGLAPRN